MCIVCVYAFYARNAMSATKQKRQVFFEWPATKQAKDCDERKETKRSGKREVRTKGRTNFFCLLVFVQIKQKKRKRSLFLSRCFPLVRSSSEESGLSFLTSAERPSRHNSSCLPVGCVTLSSPALCAALSGCCFLNFRVALWLHTICISFENALL